MAEADSFNTELLEGRGIHYHPLLASTNTEARRLAELGAPGGTVVLADAQSTGRGRRGRPWHSPQGKGIYFSMLLRPAGVSPATAAPLTLAAAAAAAGYLRKSTGIEAAVKWPNDLLIGKRKMGGILTESRTGGGSLFHLVLGMGLNVNHGEGDFPEELRGIATSLFIESGRAFERTALFLGLLNDLRSSLDLFFKEGFAPFQMPWKELSATLGNEVSFDVQGETVQGRAVNLDTGGALLVEDARGRRHRVFCGEIT